jgi:Fe-S-cluster containining protein
LSSHQPSGDASPYRAPTSNEEDQYGGDPIFMEHTKGLLRQAQALSQASFEDGSLSDVALSLARDVDTNIAAIQSGDPRKVACGKGCSFCCSQAVSATVPEILTIARHIRENWTTEEIHELRSRIASYKERITPFLEGEVDIAPRFPCPLLQDRACSVWLVRPLVCRSYNSFDANRCAVREKDASAQTPVFGLWKQRAVSDAIGLGVCKAVRSLALWPDQCDLILGLEIALDNPDAAERFAAGEAVFEPAASRGAREWKSR